MVEAQLLHTWQPVAAIAARCDLPVKTVLVELLKMEDKGQVKKARVRIDGHNKVHMFKKLERRVVLGIVMPVEEMEVEEV